MDTYIAINVYTSAFGLLVDCCLADEYDLGIIDLKTFVYTGSKEIVPGDFYKFSLNDSSTGFVYIVNLARL